VALLLGHGVKGVSQELLTYGADRVLLAITLLWKNI